MPDSERLTIIYITSLSHSGSTLLDLLLNAHSKVIAVGELSTLDHRLVGGRKGRGRACTCGAARIKNCPFWSAVGQHLQTEFGLSLGDIPTSGRRAPDYLDANVKLLKAIAKVSGVRFIVDSSKDVRRMERLSTSPEIDVVPLALVRDAKGQISSGLRKDKGRVAQLILRYNLRLGRIAVGTLFRRHVFVRYEDLARTPEATLRQTMAALGLDFEPEQLAWAEVERHTAGGNHMRHSTSSTITLDERWRERLSPLQRVLIDFGTAPARLATTLLSRTRLMAANWASETT